MLMVTETCSAFVRQSQILNKSERKKLHKRRGCLKINKEAASFISNGEYRFFKFFLSVQFSGVNFLYFLVFRAKNKDFSCYLAIFTAYLARLWDIQSRPNSISTFSMPRSRNLLKFLLAFKLPKVCSTSAGR